MIPYYPAVYIGPNGEQLPVGYHPSPISLPFDQQQQQYQHQHQQQQQQHQHQHQHQQQHYQQQQQQQQQQQHPRQLRSAQLPHQHQHLPQHQHQLQYTRVLPPQHSSHQHQLHQQQQHPLSQQHIHSQQGGPFLIHGPTSTPLSTVKPFVNASAHSAVALETITTPEMQQLESSASLDSVQSISPSSSTGSPLPTDTSSPTNGSGNLSIPISLATSRAITHASSDMTSTATPELDAHQRPALPSAQASLPSLPSSLASSPLSSRTESRPMQQTSHRPNPRSTTVAAAAAQRNNESGAGDTTTIDDANGDVPAATATAAIPSSSAVANASADTITTTSQPFSAVAAATSDDDTHHVLDAPTNTHETITDKGLAAAASEGSRQQDHNTRQHKHSPDDQDHDCDRDHNHDHKQVDHEHNLSSPPSPPSSTLYSQHQEQTLPSPPPPHPSSSSSSSHHLQSFGQYPSPYPSPGPHLTGSQHQLPFPPPSSHRSMPTSPYYPARQNPSHSKSFSGQQSQGPGTIHGGSMGLPPGAVPGGHPQGYGMQPPPPSAQPLPPSSYFGPAIASVVPPPPQSMSTMPTMPPPAGGSRRPVVFPGQGPIPPPSLPPGSHQPSMAGVRPGQLQALAAPSQAQQQYMPGVGYKYMNQGYPPDYQQHHQLQQHPGYYATPEGWRPVPTPTLQKKPKELDKAMWVGNVLNDTTIAELQAIFEAEPTEAEGDIQHDIPESIFILSKSNCAFVNYSSHEAVDRAVRRFHDREFKNTRLVCRPRKDPGSDPYSHKMTSPGRYPPQQLQHHLHGQPPYMQESMGYYGGSGGGVGGGGEQHHPLMTHHSRHDDPHLHHLLQQQQQQQQQQHYHHQQQQQHHQHELSEVQTKIERMRLEGSPMLDISSSSGGEVATPGVTGQAQHRLDVGSKNKAGGGSKKSRPSSSLGYTESRYFILKGLTEEDLKLSVQYGLWATQDHLVPLLNEAFANTKNVYLVFSANKSGEFFGYARMLEQISVENEIAITTGKEREIWQPTMDISELSPELKAAMLDEIEQASKEGRQITNEEAEVIARNSTTTKSWGTRFPIQWIHVHKVPFSRTTHLLNPLYDNREIKVSKDGTEVDPAVGEQLINLFKKSSNSRHSRRGRSSVSGAGGQEGGSRSESAGSRQSSVAGESAASSLVPPQSHRSTSSRRSSIMSTRSTGSTGGSGGGGGAGGGGGGGGGNGTGNGSDRRSSVDPSSRTQGPGYKTTPATGRGQFGGDGNGQSYPGTGGPGFRSSSRHGHFGSHSSHGSNTSQGPFASDQYPDQQRAGWNSKPNYRGGGPGGYGAASMGGGGGSAMHGGFYPPDQGHRKGGSSGSGPGGAGGKYNAPFGGGGYDYPPSHSPHTPRRHPGPPHQQHYPGSYRPNMSSPVADPSWAASSSGYTSGKHGQGGSSSASSPSGSGPHDQNHGNSTSSSNSGGGPRSGPQPPQPLPPTGQLGAGGQPIPSHLYAGQGGPPPPPPLPGGYHGAPFPPPGYPMMPPYMGYPYVAGPGPFMHGAMVWHPAGQGPPMPAGMMGAGMVHGHHPHQHSHPHHLPTSPSAMMPGGGAEGHGMEGMVPLISYDGVAYGYMPAEEAYHQPMFGYGYMPHDPHALEQVGIETDSRRQQQQHHDGSQEEEVLQDEGREQEEGHDAAETGADLSSVDPVESATAVTGNASPATSSTSTLTPRTNSSSSKVKDIGLDDSAKDGVKAIETAEDTTKQQQMQNSRSRPKNDDRVETTN